MEDLFADLLTDNQEKSQSEKVNLYGANPTPIVCSRCNGHCIFMGNVGEIHIC